MWKALSAMTVYRYISPLDSTGELEYIDITDQEILARYWDAWSRKMQEQYGDDPIINQANCIDDWVSRYQARRL